MTVTDGAGESPRSALWTAVVVGVAAWAVAGGVVLFGGAAAFGVDAPGDDRGCGPPGAELAYAPAGGDAVTLFHRGGEAFTGANTGRLVLLSDDRSASVVRLPFGPGDVRRVAVTGAAPTLVWYPGGDPYGRCGDRRPTGLDVDRAKDTPRSGGDRHPGE